MTTKERRDNSQPFPVFMFSIKNPKQELVIYASTGIGENLLTLFG